MKIEVFDIKFDNEDAVFNAGQNITGSVVLKISKPTRLLSKCTQFIFTYFYKNVINLNMNSFNKFSIKSWWDGQGLLLFLACIELTNYVINKS